MSQSVESMSLGGRLFIGGISSAGGLVIIGVASGVIPAEPGSIHAPPWVLATAGGMFLPVGVWILSQGTALARVFHYAVGPLVLVGLLSILHWVAFGPGVRQCSGGITIPFLSRGGPVGDLECRFAFGYGALFFDGVLASMGLATFADRNLEGAHHRFAQRLSNVLLLITLAPFLVVLLVTVLFKAGWEKLKG